MMQEDKVRRRFLFIVGPVTLFIILIGVTYAFFNYTRTGTANSLRTGNIYFNSDQNNTLNLTNIFPMTSTEAGNAQLDSVTVGIVGSTSYVDGEEFEITLVGVNNTINGKEVPINYIATYEATTENSIGSSSDDYWNARDSKNANIYTLNGEGQVKSGKQVLVGYVDNEGNGINGTLTIKAYIDADRIAISDTYYENAPTPTPTTPNDEYGTPASFGEGKVVLTTEEWNGLSSNPISFKIKAEAQEGIWVEEPAQGTIESCPGCKFMYLANTPMYATWNTNSQTPTILTSGLYENYQELIGTTNKNYFIGVKLNNNEVTNAYACGVKDNVPFCLEGTLYGAQETATAYATNKGLLQGTDLYNNTCTEYLDANTGNGSDYVECGQWDNSGSLSAHADSYGSVFAGVGDYDGCGVYDTGGFGCFES